MKGFTQFGKGSREGFNFPTSAGFTSSSGKVQTVGSYSRRVPKRKFAEGGSVGNSVVKREDPVTEFDRDHGGKGPLRTGYSKGGKMGSKVKKGFIPGRSFGRKPMIGD